MKRCRHTNSVEISDGPTWLAEGPGKAGRVVDIRRRICFACCEWLSMGPSNDDGPHADPVAIEQRAAEIAVEYRSVGIHWRVRDPYEWDGWIAFRNSPTDAYGLNGDEPGFPSGWLASAIAAHGDDE